MASESRNSAVRLHRFTIGNQRFIGLELPEPANKHDANSTFARHWRSVYSNVLGQVRSGIRSDKKLQPSVAGVLAEIFARKTDSPFHDRIEFHKTRSGKVLLRLPLRPKEEDYALDQLAAALKDHSATFGCTVDFRFHGRGHRP